MKIAIIGQKGIPAISGGVETHVEELASQMAGRGHEVYVYTRPNYTDKSLKTYRGVHLISLPCIPTKHLDAISHTFLACFDLLFRRVDIVHFHSIGPSLLIWLAKILKPRTPIIATFHTLCYTHKKWGSFARLSLKLGEKLCCTLADEVITISQGLKAYTYEKYQREANYIPNGVNIGIQREAKIISEKWQLKKDSYIVMVSRLIQHKGIHYAIEAFKQIQTDKKLVIVGDGFFTDNYVEELRALSADDERIMFTGRQSGEVLEELYGNAYLFVQPSESEGLSIALLEAMSYGTNVLVSDIPENKEAIAEIGYTFKNKDANDLKKQLEYLLAHGQELQERSPLLIKRVDDNYNWNKITDDVLDVYQKALAKKK